MAQRIVRRFFLGLGLLAHTSLAALRVVSFNIHGWRDEAHQDNLEGLICLLQSLQPDVLCLNEVLHPFNAPAASDPYWQAVRERRGYGYLLPASSRPLEDSQHNYLRRLADALEMPHVAFGAAVGTEDEPVPFRRSFFGQLPFGNAILARHELIDIKHAVLRVGPSDIEDARRLGGQQRTSDDLEDRAVTTARVVLPDGGGCLGVCVTHLDHKAEPLRERQIREVVHCCQEAFGDGVPHIICGDLNSFDKRDMSEEQWSAIEALYEQRAWTPPPPPDSLVQRVLKGAAYTDSFAAQIDGGGGAAGGGHEQGCLPPRTCWTNTRLDYIWLSSSATGGPAALRVLAHRTIESGVSDHLPIVCDVQLANVVTSSRR